MRNLRFAAAGLLAAFVLGAAASRASSAEISIAENTSQPDAAATSLGFHTIYRFLGATHADWPRGGVALDAVGNVYGTTLYDGLCSTCGVIYKLSKPAAGKPTWTYEILHAFGRTLQDGIAPAAPLTLKGNTIYGTTAAGANPSCGCGEVFELTKSGSGWTYKILHRFNNTQGTTPNGGVLLGSDGTLYGTTSGGGSQGAGVVYKIAKGGAFSVLHTFGGNSGGGPEGELIFGKDGAIYGTTFGEGKYNRGVVFRITPGGAYAVLYNFMGDNQPFGPPDGADPQGRLALGKDGTIYGTTAFGGDPTGYGTAWSLTPKSGGKWTYAQLYRFGRAPIPNAPNLPHSGLVIDLAGNLYGTGAGGGAYGSGTLYRLSPPKSGKIWNVTVLHSFKGFDPGGDTPFADIELSGGVLYGSSLTGGIIGGNCTTGCGTVFDYKL